MTTDLYETQIALEEESRSMGIARFQENLAKSREGGRESGTYYGNALMRRSIAPLADAIRAFVIDANSGTVGRRNVAVKFIEEVDPEVLALLTCRVVMDRLTRGATLVSITANLGGAVEDELMFTAFEDEAKGLFRTVKENARGSMRHRRTVLNYAYGKFIGTWDKWTVNDRVLVGTKLVDLMIETLGFITINTIYKNGKAVVTVNPTQELLDWVDKTEENASALQPYFMPMVVKPRPWEDSVGGGYLLPCRNPLTLVKTRNRAYLEELSSIPDQLAPVLEAVNAVQETAWQINKKVHEVVNHFWESEEGIAGLPSGIQRVIRPCPLPKDLAREDRTEEQSEELRIWKREAAEIHAYNAKVTGRRMGASRTLVLANKFAAFDAFYFPYQLDFRGRVYAITHFLTPQGEDLSKGLLRFAEGKPIGNGTGPGWLAIHGANVFGNDKVSLTERIDWVEENEARILSCANDPKGDLWWSEADKPWSFLAFCFEWASYLENGADHITHLPIAQDGSCSGLQHFSAALRDKVGGTAVNLVPSELPSDVYQEVADLAKSKLRVIASTSGMDEDQEEALLAARILDFGITRKATKRSTMTLPYGSTRHSCIKFVCEWIDDEVDKRKEKGLPNPLEGKEEEAGSLLGRIVWDAIGETVIAARKAMGWLREVAGVLAKEDLPVCWTTPDGLPVMQNYLNTTPRRIKTKLGDKIIRQGVVTDTDKLDKRRQANGVAPNWVHSMDATHLRLAVRYCKLNGIDNVAVIHDSFGTHACDTDMLGACLRQSFVDLYQEDVLATFRDEICAVLPTSATVPDMPAKGLLDINLVKDSDYVFA
jgi:DNA-directed RNA polymerase